MTQHEHLHRSKATQEARTDWIIYIDEGWPLKEKQGEETTFGVVAGLIWKRSKVDQKELKPAPQHMRYGQGTNVDGRQRLKSIEVFTEEAKGHMNAMNACQFAQPFLFRYYPRVGIDRMKAYESMILESLRFLFGSWLPSTLENFPPKKPIGVEVLCESLAKSDFTNGRNLTEFVNGILRTLNDQNTNPNYMHWIVTGLQWVCNFKAKQAGHVPNDYFGFADLIAYHSNKDESKLAASLAGLNLLPTSCQFDLKHGFVNTLDQLDTLVMADAHQFLREMAPLQDHPVMKKLLEQKAKLWEKLLPNAGEALLKNLDYRYTHEVRDLRKLSSEFRLVRSMVGKLPDSAPSSLRLLEVVLELQEKNHYGAQSDFTQLQSSYAALRGKALENGHAELVAHVDLNLAVSASDVMDFETARNTVEKLLEDEKRIPLLSRAKAYSAWGQYLSLGSEFEQAKECFDLAIETLQEAEIAKKIKKKDLDQTSIYRAFNAIDSGDVDAGTFVKEIINSGGIGVELKHQYRYHLWVRWLYSQEDYLKEKAQCLKELDASADSLPKSHPWQLIFLYAARFAAQCDQNDCVAKWYERSLTICDAKAHGATLHLIGAMIATVAWLHCGNDSFKTRALNFLRKVDLPAAEDKVECLRSLLESKADSERIPEALSILQFNYR